MTSVRTQNEPCYDVFNDVMRHETHDNEHISLLWDA